MPQYNPMNIAAHQRDAPVTVRVHFYSMILYKTTLPGEALTMQPGDPIRKGTSGTECHTLSDPHEMMMSHCFVINRLPVIHKRKKSWDNVCVYPKIP